MRKLNLLVNSLYSVHNHWLLRIGFSGSYKFDQFLKRVNHILDA
jgi:hypothetical protein